MLLGLAAPVALPARLRSHCPPGQSPDPKTGACTVIIDPPPDPGDPTDPGGGGGPARSLPRRWSAGSPWGARLARCRARRRRVGGCSREQCYAKAASPQPAKSDPVWQGHTDGAIYDCYRPVLGPGGFIVSQFWSASPPGVGAPPDPAQLARQAIAVMNLHAVRIGIVPEARPGRVGLVGMPVWMWADAPDPATWGPVTKSASAGGYTVTATAKVNRVVWAMGDGEVVVCRSPGHEVRGPVRQAVQPGLWVQLRALGPLPGAGDVVLAGRLVRHGPERHHPAVVHRQRADHRRRGAGPQAVAPGTAGQKGERRWPSTLDG